MLMHPHALTDVFQRAYGSGEVPTFETLAVSVPKSHVYHVELNRPKKLNSFNNSMWTWVQILLPYCSPNLTPQLCYVVNLLTTSFQFFSRDCQDFSSVLALGFWSENRHSCIQLSKYLVGLLSGPTCVKWFIVFYIPVSCNNAFPPWVIILSAEW